MLAALFGGLIGLFEACISTLIIAAVYQSIPDYKVGIDVAAGVGLGQAFIIIYHHMGRIEVASEETFSSSEKKTAREETSSKKKKLQLLCEDD